MPPALSITPCRLAQVSICLFVRVSDRSKSRESEEDEQDVRVKRSRGRWEKGLAPRTISTGHVWTKTADEVLTSVEQCCRRISNSRGQFVIELNKVTGRLSSVKVCTCERVCSLPHTSALTDIAK
jgi:hypothetical protein